MRNNGGNGGNHKDLLNQLLQLVVDLDRHETNSAKAQANTTNCSPGDKEQKIWALEKDDYFQPVTVDGQLARPILTGLGHKKPKPYCPPCVYPQPYLTHFHNCYKGTKKQQEFPIVSTISAYEPQEQQESCRPREGQRLSEPRTQPGRQGFYMMDETTGNRYPDQTYGQQEEEKRNEPQEHTCNKHERTIELIPKSSHPGEESWGNQHQNRKCSHKREGHRRSEHQGNVCRNQESKRRSEPRKSNPYCGKGSLRNKGRDFDRNYVSDERPGGYSWWECSKNDKYEDEGQEAWDCGKKYRYGQGGKKHSRNENSHSGCKSKNTSCPCNGHQESNLPESNYDPNSHHDSHGSIQNQYHSGHCSKESNAKKSHQMEIGSYDFGNQMRGSFPDQFNRRNGLPIESHGRENQSQDFPPQFKIDNYQRNVLHNHPGRNEHHGAARKRSSMRIQDLDESFEFRKDSGDYLKMKRRKSSFRMFERSDNGSGESFGEKRGSTEHSSGNKRKSGHHIQQNTHPYMNQFTNDKRASESSRGSDKMRFPHQPPNSRRRSDVCPPIQQGEPKMLTWDPKAEPPYRRECENEGTKTYIDTSQVNDYLDEHRKVKEAAAVWDVYGGQDCAHVSPPPVYYTYCCPDDPKHQHWSPPLSTECRYPNTCVASCFDHPVFLDWNNQQPTYRFYLQRKEEAKPFLEGY